MIFDHDSDDDRLLQAGCDYSDDDDRLLHGCDSEHWLVVMRTPPGGTYNPTTPRDELIDSYIKTLAQVVGSEDEAKQKIYSVSTRYYFAFGALVSEELSHKLKELPGVIWVLPDSYLDVENKDYGGEPFINGEAVPYDPKYHEEWVRNNERQMPTCHHLQMRMVRSSLKYHLLMGKVMLPAIKVTIIMMAKRIVSLLKIKVAHNQDNKPGDAMRDAPGLASHSNNTGSHVSCRCHCRGCSPSFQGGSKQINNTITHHGGWQCYHCGTASPFQGGSQPASQQGSNTMSYYQGGSAPIYHQGCVVHHHYYSHVHYHHHHHYNK
ncbi:hypothetical protein PR202_ga15320 [Eleusine coracana subsp. coracana]|uniref:MORF/ORRM1/DAG-like MORF domain-containing protein n=1 Tax=Eleusine coracana subsp. coracana TaxID=191504 RepID=A0AAV5CJK6_ELECO|nr:hypothetical protein PR202_ga15320 [Eleusine coracana subsp. coracana]